MGLADTWTIGLHRAKLRIDHTLVQGTHIGLPVLLRAADVPWSMINSADTLRTLNVAPNVSGRPACTVRFSSDPLGNHILPCEVVAITAGSSVANAYVQIYVRLPEVLDSADTEFYIWWQNYTVTGVLADPEDSPTGRYAVWSGWSFVCHPPHGDGSATARSLRDSSGHIGASTLKGYGSDPLNNTGLDGSQPLSSNSVLRALDFTGSGVGVPATAKSADWSQADSDALIALLGQNSRCIEVALKHVGTPFSEDREVRAQVVGDLYKWTDDPVLVSFANDAHGAGIVFTAVPNGPITEGFYRAAFVVGSNNENAGASSILATPNIRVDSNEDPAYLVAEITNDWSAIRLGADSETGPGLQGQLIKQAHRLSSNDPFLKTVFSIGAGNPGPSGDDLGHTRFSNTYISEVRLSTFPRGQDYAATTYNNYNSAGFIIPGPVDDPDGFARSSTSSSSADNAGNSTSSSPTSASLSTGSSPSSLSSATGYPIESQLVERFKLTERPTDFDKEFSALGSGRALLIPDAPNRYRIADPGPVGRWRFVQDGAPPIPVDGGLGFSPWDASAPGTFSFAFTFKGGLNANTRAGVAFGQLSDGSGNNHYLAAWVVYGAATRFVTVTTGRNVQAHPFGYYQGRDFKVDLSTFGNDPDDGNWHTLLVAIDVLGRSAQVYFDGVAVGVAGVTDLAETILPFGEAERLPMREHASIDLQVVALQDFQLFSGLPDPRSISNGKVDAYFDSRSSSSDSSVDPLDLSTNTSSSSNNTLPNRLVRFFPLDDGRETLQLQETVRGLDVQLLGGVPGLPGVQGDWFGYTGPLGGGDRYLAPPIDGELLFTGDGRGLPTGNATRTISWWQLGVNDGVIFSYGGYARGELSQFVVAVNNGFLQVVVEVDPAAALNQQGVTPAGRIYVEYSLAYLTGWHHYVLTYENGSATLTIDGGAPDTKVLPVSAINTAPTPMDRLTLLGYVPQGSRPDVQPAIAYYGHQFGISRLAVWSGIPSADELDFTSGLVGSSSSSTVADTPSTGSDGVIARPASLSDQSTGSTNSSSSSSSATSASTIKSTHSSASSLSSSVSESSGSPSSGSPSSQTLSSASSELTSAWKDSDQTTSSTSTASSNSSSSSSSRSLSSNSSRSLSSNSSSSYTESTKSSISSWTDPNHPTYITGVFGGGQSYSYHDDAFPFSFDVDYPGGVVAKNGPNTAIVYIAFYAGDMSSVDIRLKSPQGTEHSLGNFPSNQYVDTSVIFSSNEFLGENLDGTWQLVFYTNGDPYAVFLYGMALDLYVENEVGASFSDASSETLSSSSNTSSDSAQLQLDSSTSSGSSERSTASTISTPSSVSLVSDRTDFLAWDTSSSSSQSTVTGSTGTSASESSSGDVPGSESSYTQSSLSSITASEQSSASTKSTNSSSSSRSPSSNSGSTQSPSSNSPSSMTTPSGSSYSAVSDNSSSSADLLLDTSSSSSSWYGQQINIRPYPEVNVETRIYPTDMLTLALKPPAFFCRVENPVGSPYDRLQLRISRPGGYGGEASYNLYLYYEPGSSYFTFDTAVLDVNGFEQEVVYDFALQPGGTAYFVLGYGQADQEPLDNEFDVEFTVVPDTASTSSRSLSSGSTNHTSSSRSTTSDSTWSASSESSSSSSSSSSETSWSSQSLSVSWSSQSGSSGSSASSVSAISGGSLSSASTNSTASSASSSSSSTESWSSASTDSSASAVSIETASTGSSVSDSTNSLSSQSWSTGSTGTSASSESSASESSAEQETGLVISERRWQLAYGYENIAEGTSYPFVEDSVLGRFVVDASIVLNEGVVGDVRLTRIVPGALGSRSAAVYAGDTLVVSSTSPVSVRSFGVYEVWEIVGSGGTVTLVVDPLQGAAVYDDPTGLLFVPRVLTYLSAAGISSMVVGAIEVAGPGQGVVLAEGSNIGLQLTNTPDAAEITISAVERPDGPCVPAELKSRTSAPYVKTINGVAPTARGDLLLRGGRNLTIRVGEKTGVTFSGGKEVGPSFAISVENHGRPCCDCSDYAAAFEEIRRVHERLSVALRWLLKNRELYRQQLSTVRTLLDAEVVGSRYNELKEET